MIPYLGQIAALLAATMWSSSSFLFTYAAVRIGPLQLNIERMMIAAVLLMVTMFAAGRYLDMGTQQYILLSLSGILGLVLGDSFLFKAFKEIGPRMSMLIMSANPAIAAVLAFIILGEDLSLWSILGIAITITGISMVILEKPKVKNKFNITRLGILAAALGATGQAAGLVVAKMANNIAPIHFLPATFIRIFTATVILMALLLVTGRLKRPFSYAKSDKRNLFAIILASVLGPYLGITLSYVAVINTKVGIASTLMATMPIIMLPMSRMIHKEKLTAISIAGAFIAVAGVALLFLL